MSNRRDGAALAGGAGAASVWRCIAGTFLLRMGNSATGVLLGLMLASIDRETGDVPAVAVGLLAASFYLAELLGAPWFGVLSDRNGRRRYMLAGPIFGALAVQLIGWPGLLVGWPVLLIAMAIGRAVEGLSTASTGPSTLSFLSAQTAASPSWRGRVMAWYEMATVVGIGSGFVVGGLLWDRVGHGAFIAVSAIYAFSFTTFWAIRDIPSLDRVPPAQHIALLRIIQRPRVVRFIPAWLLVNTVVGVWFTHSAFQFTGGSEAGQFLTGAFTGSTLGAGFALFSVAFTAGIYLWGTQIGLHRKTSIMSGTIAGIYIVCAGLFGINHLGQIGGAVVPVLTAVFVVGVVIASGFTPAALAYLADLSEEVAEQRGAVMGLYSVILGLGQLLGGALGGPFADIAAIDGLILLSALLGTGALLAVVFLRRFEMELSPSFLVRQKL